MNEGLLTELVDEVRTLRVALVDGGRPEKPLTRTEAAQYLGIHADTLYKWAVEGRVAYSRLGDGAKAPMRFTRKDLDDFMRDKRIPTVEDAQANL